MRRWRHHGVDQGIAVAGGERNAFGLVGRDRHTLVVGHWWGIVYRPGVARRGPSLIGAVAGAHPKGVFAIVQAVVRLGAGTGGKLMLVSGASAADSSVPICCMISVMCPARSRARTVRVRITAIKVRIW